MPLVCLYELGRHLSVVTELFRHKSEITVESQSATNFKGFEAVHNTILDIDDRLLSFDVQTEAGQMYDALHFSKTLTN